MSTAVAIKLIDLASKARAKKLSSVSGRDTELSRLARLLLRPKRSHVVIIGEPGSGKTSLTEALALSLHEGKHAPLTEKMYRLDSTPIMSLLINGDSLRQCLQVLTQATTQLTQAIIIIEDIQLLAADDPARLELTLALIGALASHDGIKIITTTTPAAYRRIFQSDYSFNRLFDVLELTQPTPEAAILMVEQGVVELERHHHQRVSTEAVASSVEFGGRFTHGRALPDTALRLIEEACAMTSIAGESVVTAQTIKQVVAEREKLPVSGLDPSSRSNLTGLEDALQRSVVGQSTAIRTIARTIAKAQLGFGDDTKPRGSFLMLGPSGVGKTETAKAIAATYYSGPKALVRLDMSEYAEAHAAVRLIGSPPGYVGYEEGGQLTGAVLREPYSLVLLDEIEKAHPKVYDLFLQLLDDGRLTDSSGQTVDFTSVTVLATSNVGSREIARDASLGINVHSPAYMQDVLQPLLFENYRPEFINRFDAVLVYEPLAETHLVALAQRELQALAKRLRKVGISFAVSDETITHMLRPLLDPLFGARPVKRLIATHFETPIAHRLINGQLRQPSVITGTEAWLTTEVHV